jgi:hypothetical protein
MLRSEHAQFLKTFDSGSLVIHCTHTCKFGPRQHPRCADSSWGGKPQLTLLHSIQQHACIIVELCILYICVELPWYKMQQCCCMSSWMVVLKEASCGDAVMLSSRQPP